MKPARSELKVLGVGAAACAACCAGPILGFLGTFAAVGAAAALIAGAFVLAAVFGIIAAVIVVRRRSRRIDCGAATVTSIPMPTRRT